MYKFDTEKTPAQEFETQSRRSFLTMVVGAGGALWAAVAAYPLYRYYIAPEVEVDNTIEVDAGDPAQYAPGSISRIAFGKKPVFLLAEGGGVFMAVSAICTHLGCVISPNDDNSGFMCPCHGGKYTRDGTNVGGPPPRPLDTYHTEVREDGNLWIVRADMVGHTAEGGEEPA